MYIIGVLSFFEQTIDEVPEIEQGLNHLGYAVHLEQMAFNLKSPKIGDYYYEKEAVILWLCRCFGDTARCRKAVEGFVEADVDAIVAMTRPAVDITLQATEDTGIPVIFTHVTREAETEIEFQRLHASGKVTGIWDIWLEMAEERLTLVTEVVPPPTTVHAIYNPRLVEVAVEADILRDAARKLGLELILHPAGNIAEVKETVSGLQARPEHAIFRLADPTTASAASLMGAVAHEHYIPYIGLTQDELERCGSLFTLDTHGVGKQAAEMIDRLLKGELPSAIPFCEPSRKTLAVNLQKAQDLGLIVSPAVLSQAETILPAEERVRFGTRFLLVLVASLLALSLFIFLAGVLDFPYLVGLTFGANLLLMLWMWIFLNRRIVTPIHKLAIAAEKIGSGELNTPIGEWKVENEVDALAHALRRMKSNLKASYVELEELNQDLQQQVVELTSAYSSLQTMQQELELASRRIIEAEDSQRFALTTYIHDEVIRPLDDLMQISEELGHPDLIRLSNELEQRIRQVRFDLSTPILQDIGLELRRLVQETLPSIYPDGRSIQINLDLSALDQRPPLKPACTFLLYRFVRGAVSNVYRHSRASQVQISADIHEEMLSLCVSDNGHGFDPAQVERFVRAGHYFFHDIQIRVQQLDGGFSVQSHLGKGTVLTVSLPLMQKTKTTRKALTHRKSGKGQKSYLSSTIS
jgi:putative ABC transport system substrate-binding protein